MSKAKGKKKQSHPTFHRQREEVPLLVTQTLDYLERNALNVEGLFRVSGSVIDTQELKKQYDKGKKVDLSKVKDPNVVAGVLKLWLRELSDPLLTFELYDCWIAVHTVKDVEARIEYIKKTLRYLPPGNRAILKRLGGFLRLVKLNEARTKMTVTNLAIVFAPNLLRPVDESPAQALQNAKAANDLIMDLIEYYDNIFLNQALHVKEEEVLQRVPEQQRRAIQQTLRRGTLILAISESELAAMTEAGDGEGGDAAAGGGNEDTAEPSTDDSVPATLTPPTHAPITSLSPRKRGGDAREALPELPGHSGGGGGRELPQKPSDGPPPPPAVLGVVAEGTPPPTPAAATTPSTAAGSATAVLSVISPRGGSNYLPATPMAFRSAGDASAASAPPKIGVGGVRVMPANLPPFKNQASAPPTLSSAPLLSPSSSSTANSSSPPPAASPRPMPPPPTPSPVSGATAAAAAAAMRLPPPAPANRSLGGKVPLVTKLPPPPATLGVPSGGGGGGGGGHARSEQQQSPRDRSQHQQHSPRDRAAAPTEVDSITGTGGGGGVEAQTEGRAEEGSTESPPVAVVVASVGAGGGGRPLPRPTPPKPLSVLELVNKMLEGNTGEVSAYLVALPEEERATKSTQIRQLLAQKLLEIDQLGV